MRKYDLYYTDNEKLQDWLEERGIAPIRVKGKNAYYKYTAAFRMLLDDYYIEKIIF